MINTFDFYASTRHSVGETILAVGIRLRGLINREARKLQQSVHAAFCDAASCVQESYVRALEAEDRSLNITVGLARPERVG